MWCEERRGIFNGQTVYYRSFLAASFPSFWKSYQQLAAYARHCYEVSISSRLEGHQGMSSIILSECQLKYLTALVFNPPVLFSLPLDLICMTEGDN